MRCLTCQETKDQNKFPEAYPICYSCLITRPKNPRPCRTCKKTKPRNKFPVGGGLTCCSCVSRRPKDKARRNSWRRKQYADPDYKEKYLAIRRERNRKRWKQGKIQAYDQSTFRRWLCVKMRGVLYTKNKDRKSYNLTLDFLCSLWQRQKGLCAITKLPMTHRRNDLFAASVDRIDNSRGYLKGNIQLVCQAINLAKNKHSNQEISNFVQAIRKSGTRPD